MLSSQGEFHSGATLSLGLMGWGVHHRNINEIKFMDRDQHTIVIHADISYKCCLASHSTCHCGLSSRLNTGLEAGLRPIISTNGALFKAGSFLQAAAAGKVPAEVLRADADALAAGKPLPYARLAEDPTPVNSRPVTSVRQAQPLDHN